ncbi:putative Myosin heavy chain-related protein [Melia azedarach]|uniref:Myosin heavy chain-related protein n=1 Tax=Melia azedarach TaxID=155640 RepID=A0ACC1XMD0_MELAZ|nr:putative Myosin heavy chain-related protein [Melia azedarach]
MFKSARWRSDKNKIKAVFKLQFHATQVAQLGENALMISVIPGDVGKPTVRLEKAAIQNGCCRWGNPVYETVKFVREPKTGKISERIYNFIVSTGLSKAGYLGEASIDFADYVEATKTSTVPLPLKNSRSKAILHVSIQRLQENVDQREIEEIDDGSTKTQDRTLRTQLSNSDAEDINKSNSTEGQPPSKTVLNAELNGNCSASTGSDITLSSSESSSGLNTPREQDDNGFLSSLSHSSVPHKSTENTPTTIYEEHQRLQWEWSGGSDHGTSTDDSTNGFQDTFIREKSQQTSDVEIEKLKSELVTLARQVDLSELELQTLRKQIVKESKRGQDLSREVISLKEERDAYKLECEKLKNFHERMDEAKVKNKLQFEGGDPWVLLEEVRQELNYEKDLNANLRLQLEKTQESNNELILAVQDLDEMLEQKNKEVSNLSNKSGSHDNAEEVRGNISRSETDDDEEQKALEELVKEHRDAKETYMLEQKIMDLYSEIEIYRRDRDELEMQMEQLALDYEILKQENHDISYKLEQSQLQEQLKMQYECSSSFANASELEMQIETLENELKKKSKDFSDSLATIKELESQIAGLENEHKKQSKEFSDSQDKVKELETQIKGLENELKKQSKEFSDSLATIKELEAHIQNLEEDLDKQVEVYEADLEVVTRAKVEQEQRAIHAEEALRKTRMKNANTAEKLQEEFRRLSVQMASTFDANEKVAMKALEEASELCMQKSHLEEMLRRASEEVQLVRDDYETKLCQLSDELNMRTDQIGQMLKEVGNMSTQLQQQKKHEEEVTGALSMEILQLKAEMEKLRIENNSFSDNAEQKESLRVELEQMKTSVEEYELMIQRVNMERNELEGLFVLVKKDAEKSLEELQRMRRVQDEKEVAVELLKSELEKHKVECHDLKNSLVEDELEKEKLRKQVFQLKGDLKKKEDALKLRDSNRRASVSDGTRSTLRNNKPAAVPQGTKEVASLREKIKLLEGQIKLKEIALETSTTSFLEKEKDLRNKIEELECRVEELNQNSTSFCELSLQKVATDTIHLTSNGDLSEENGNIMPLVKSNGDISVEKELKPSTINIKDNNIADLLTELASLKEKNESMEVELKEMQERYSEISLKFAEVEGERQKLVMTVRSLKNARKS